MKNGKKKAPLKHSKPSKFINRIMESLVTAENDCLNKDCEIVDLNHHNDYLREKLISSDRVNFELNSANAANEKQLANAAQLSKAMYRGFAQERDEKYAEIYRLENRMRALGYDLPDDRKAGV